MDLSNLSSDLPPTAPLEHISVNELSRELTAEFKNAAKSVAALYNSASQPETPGKTNKVEFANAARSVASLYRLTNNAKSVLLNKGYLECLDDLLHVITNGDDIENWALTKRAEITNSYNQQIPSLADSAADAHLPSEYDFSMTLDLSPGYNFRPSVPLLSVNHPFRSRGRKGPARSRKLKNNAGLPSLEDSATSTSDDDSDLADLDDRRAVARKLKKYQEETYESAKKRRKLAEREEST